MCGISGYTGQQQAAPIILQGLERLEYRGYDSAGIATQDSTAIHIKKGAGDINTVNQAEHLTESPGTIGIGHTRWSTHGKATQTNAHPHQSQNNVITAVHNGIIENYNQLKKQLQSQGYTFISETDTEVIPHYIEQKLHVGKTVPEAIREFMREARGTFAILFMKQGDKNLYALKRDSPLAIGIGNNETFIGSDIYAFSDKTNKAIFFEDNEYAIITPTNIDFFDNNGNAIKKDIKAFEWKDTAQTKQNYEHFMLKEIMEEPEAVKRLLLSLETDQEESFTKLTEMIKSAHKIVFVASGTSYHATLLGAYFLHQQGVEAQTLIASEFEHFAHIDKESLVIAFSQSGETMDVIDALKYAKEKGAQTAAVVNVPYSTIQRLVDLSIQTQAGQEICVASTKAFVNQVIILLRIAQKCGYKIDIGAIPKKIQDLFTQIPAIKSEAKKIAHNEHAYVLGRGLGYPIAREIALKIKEISYVHAEGMMGGELKHGTIALIETGTPVISLIHNGESAMRANTKEVEARGAQITTFGNEEDSIPISAENEGEFGILTAVAGQLLAYYIAKERNCPIDKPRNLAKSVTVR